MEMSPQYRTVAQPEPHSAAGRQGLRFLGDKFSPSEPHSRADDQVCREQFIFPAVNCIRGKRGRAQLGTVPLHVCVYATAHRTIS